MTLVGMSSAAPAAARSLADLPPDVLERVLSVLPSARDLASANAE